MVNADRLSARFREIYPGQSPSVLARAPGRVNLIGEHVDYNDGLVLPLAIDQAVYVVANRSGRDVTRAYSETVGASIEFDPRSVQPTDCAGWGAYVQGVAAVLRDAGVTPGSVDLYIDGDLPLGAGLSSSAALEVAVAKALAALADVDMEPDRLARLCRRAEHEYAGVPCGIMDQLTCAAARAGTIMRIDCRDEAVEYLPWPDEKAVVLLVDSRCRHRLSQGLYAERVEQCRQALACFRQADPTLASLRDVLPRRLAEQSGRMPPDVAARARHVVMEIERTRIAADALRSGDLVTFGRAMNESHASLRDDYEVSSPQLDDLAAAVRSVPGVFGARLTGAGFGGCVVAVATRAAVGTVEPAIRADYDARYGVRAELMVTTPCDGAGVTRLDD